MTTPFDELQAYYGPEGAGAKKPGNILDTEHPLFQALWGAGYGVGYVARTRAEAATELWAASRDLFRREGWALRSWGGAWQLRGPSLENVAEGATPEDALSAAILAREQAPR